MEAAADLAQCRADLRAGSRTFWAASLLLPKGVREPATALYAFCRAADDAVDLGLGGENALDELWHRLDRAYAGRPLGTPVDRAFARTVRRFAIPRALPAALVEGIAWDTQGRRYETLEDLHAYAARVAGTVGAMMALLMGLREPGALARACDLGVAMQLSNIARDIGEDAANGRLYLPRSWLRDGGLDPEAWLARPRPHPAISGAVAGLLREAETLYARAEAGIARLPAGCRPGIFAARLLYAEIGREVERLGPAALHSRAVVPGARKLALLSQAVAAAALAGGPVHAPPLPAVAFLVQAVDATPAPPTLIQAAPWWDMGARLVRVLTLFDRLERWEQAGRPGKRLRREELGQTGLEGA